MCPHSTKFLIFVVLVFTVTACQSQVTPPATVTPPGHELTITALVQTIAALATSTPTPSPSVTETPSLTPTLTDTPTPTRPQVSVSSETNCRTGPTKYYKFIWEAEVGKTFEVVGRHTPSGYWIIRLDDGRECWLWGQHATVAGDISSLTEYIPPSAGRLEGEVRHSGAAEAGKIADAFVDIGLGFEVYRTGNDGKFVFEDVPVGEVKIKVTHATYQFNDPRVYITLGQLTFVIVPRITAVILTIPPPTPTRRCPLLQPNCQLVPTFAPPVP